MRIRCLVVAMQEPVDSTLVDVHEYVICFKKDKEKGKDMSKMDINVTVCRGCISCPQVRQLICSLSASQDKGREGVFINSKMHWTHVSSHA